MLLIDALSFFVVAGVLLTVTDWQRWPLLWLLETFAVVSFVALGRGVDQPLTVKFNLAAEAGLLHRVAAQPVSDAGRRQSLGDDLAALPVAEEA